jgi:parallel beta-helix repeat protein
VVAVLSVLAVVLSLTHSGSRSAADADAMTMPSGGASMASVPLARASHAVKVCNQPVLRSPYSYHGRQGHYQSGTRGLPTYGKPGTSFPAATAGVVVPTGVHTFASYQLSPDTIYYLLPGMHFGSFQADKGDIFVGGYWNKQGSVLYGSYRNTSLGGQAIDSNSTNGDQPNVVIEYLTIENYQPDMDAAAINQEANTGWIIRNNTIKLNVPGAGVILGAGNQLTRNCLTLNGQYGFQSTDTNGFGKDSLTDGPYGVTVTQNEISYNDTCDLSGLMNNPEIGWKDYNPVPYRYRNPNCGNVVGDGNQGGFKLWQTNGVTISRNNIHDNWGPGAWVDTNNANTTFTGNVFIRNEGPAIIEEISYNFAIIGNYIAGNDLIDGLNNAGFPQAAIYVSESGSDSVFGGVPACAEALCSRQPAYPRQSVIRGNLLVNNGGSIFLWQSSNRYCSDGFDGPCPLVAGGASGPFTPDNCKANLPSASVDTTTFTGEKTGTPQQDWWDGCLWRTSNVLVTRNTIDFNPAHIFGCNASSWPDCGAGGIFSQYGSPPNNRPGWTVPTQLTFYQNNLWSRNTYNGPSTFFAWNQGNGENPVNWTSWTGSIQNGDKCTSPGERHSGYCSGAFGQDTGSVYHFSPVS